MQNRKLAVGLVLTAVLVLGASGMAEPSPHVGELLAALGLPNNQEGGRAFNTVRHERKGMVEGLIRILRESDEDALSPAERDGGPRHRAIDLLGLLRAAEATGLLIVNVTYEVKPLLTDTYLPDPYYPAAFALARIGKPASKAALVVLRETEDDERRGALLWVIRRVEGDELARHLIEQQIERAHSTGYKERLREALELLEKSIEEQPMTGDPW